MSETAKKRARKSKLVPRDIYELDEDENIVSDLLVPHKWKPVENPEPKIKNKKAPIKKKASKAKKKGTQAPKNKKNVTKDMESTERPPMPLSPMQFSVKVEVERESPDEEFSTIDEAESKVFLSAFEDFCTNNTTNSPTDKKQLLEQYLKAKGDTKNDITTKILDHGCYVTLKDILEAINNISNEATTNDLDQILCTASRNIIGNVHRLDLETDPADVKLQRMYAIFNKIAPSILERPCAYVCTICDRKWDHLYYFREHIRLHPHCLVTTEMEGRTGTDRVLLNVIAYAENNRKRSGIVIPYCYRCDEIMCPHMDKNMRMKCGCPQFLNMYLEDDFKDHETACMIRKSQAMGCPLFTCDICATVFLNEDEYKEHFPKKHTVRSDVPVLTDSVFCHNCLSTDTCRCVKNMVQCDYCFTNFHSQYQLDHHLNENKIGSNVCCVCHDEIEKKCMLNEHYVGHSDKFVAVYHCVDCQGHFNLYGTRDAVKQHNIEAHSKKESAYFDVMIIPKAVIEQYIAREMKEYALDEANMFEIIDESCTSTQGTDKIVKRKNIRLSKYRQRIKEDPELYEMFRLKDRTRKKIKRQEIKRKREKYSMKDKVILQIQEPRVLVRSQLRPTETLTFVINRESESENEDINGLSTSIDIKQELEEYQEAPIIKEEPEEQEEFEDDIIRLNFDSPNTSQSVAVSQDDCIYKCGTCMFEGNEEQFKKHREEDCLVVKNYGCTKCMMFFSTLWKYVFHLRWHGYEKFTCPGCKEVFSNNSDAVRHVSFHYKQDYCKVVRPIATEDKLKSFPAGKTLLCKKCSKIVSSKYMFQHWETHVDLMPVTHPGGVHVSPDRSKNVIQSKTNDIQFKTNDIQIKTNYIQINTSDETAKATSLLIERTAEPSAHSSRPPSVAESAGSNATHPEAHDFDQIKNRNKLDRVTLFELIDRLQNPAQWTAENRQCLVCNRVFLRNNDSKRHLIEHLLSDAFTDSRTWLVCQICADVFQKVDRYKKHMRDHACLPVYKCDLCNKTFSDSSNFTKHKKVHSIPTYQCDLCNNKFLAKKSMEKHIIDHMLSEPYDCDVCGITLSSKSAYNRHYRIKHNKTITRFVCKRCGVRFMTLKAKWDHLWEVHGERKDKADCPICGMKFRKFHDVKMHMKDAHDELEMYKMHLENKYGADHPLVNAQYMCETETLVVYEDE